MLVLGGLAALLAAVFVSMGAYPVVGFLGLELAGLWVALRWVSKRRSARTYVRVTDTAIEVRRIDAAGGERSARLPAAFARVRHEEGRRGPAALSIVSYGRSVDIGEHLSEQERAEFADRLRAALRAAGGPQRGDHAHG